MWPTNVKTDKQRQKLIMGHFVPDTYQLCSITIKYRAITYEAAAQKLKYLETASTVEETEDELRERRKRERRGVNSKYKDFQYSSDDDELPQLPPKSRNVLNTMESPRESPRNGWNMIEKAATRCDKTCCEHC
ncbi:hypothetical protein FQR65_LT14183 [Abscondita terminalis]|nr:hypothetical protein FQR65_LT14183 [Abscondita terminalis]